MTMYSVEVYHNAQARFMPYEAGQRLTLTAFHWLELPTQTSEEVADTAFQIFNADLDLLESACLLPGGETAFLAACVYRLLHHRSLSVGDVVHVAAEGESQWLACEPAGWCRIAEPANRHGAPLTGDTVYEHLRAQRSSR